MKISKIDSAKALFIRMNNLRGLLALVVLFSHIWGYTGMRILVPFNKTVTIAVAFFFFLSGYGMMRSYDRKENYLKEVIRVKIPYLLWMALMAYIFSVLLEILMTRGATGSQFYHPAGIKNLIVSTNWYVYELIGFYLVFSITKKFISSKYQILFVAVLSGFAFTALYYSGLVEAYYNSIIGFCLGMFWAKHDHSIFMDQYSKGYLPAAIIVIITFAAMLVFDRSSILAAIDRNLAACGSIILAMYVMQYVDLNDRVNRYLSKISPEIYFYHMPVALLCSNVIENVYVYAAVVIGATMIIAPVFHNLNGHVQNRIRKLYTLSIKENGK